MTHFAIHILLLFTCTPLLHSADIIPTPDELLIPMATPKIDGDLTEWDITKKGYRIDPTKTGNDDAISLHQNDPGNPFKGEKDLSAWAALSWDKDYLYIAGQVTDDDLRGIKPDTGHNAGPPGWACDSVMFRIHSFRQPLKTNNPYSKTPFLAPRYVVHPGGRGHLLDNSSQQLDKVDSYWKLPQGSDWVSRETEDGYVVEAAVPWKSLEFKPQTGELFFCGFLLGDIDDGEQLNQLGWNFNGSEPSAMRVFRLADTSGATAMLSVASRSVEAGKKWSVSYRVDARAMDIRLTRLTLTGPENQQLDIAINTDIVKGKSATDVLVVEEMPARPGPYKATLVTDVDGKTVELCSESIEILPGKPPAPLITNPAGEMHHMRPDRVAHNAWEDWRRGILHTGFVNDRTGYEKYILTHVKDYVDKTMENYIRIRSRYIDQHVLMALTLLKLTGEERYADLIRRGVDLALTLQKENLDIHLLFGLVTMRYHVWQHDKERKLATPDAEKDFQELWARAASEHPPEWMYSEWGYHNRCWHRYYQLKIARHFAQKLGKPIGPRVDEYLAFHEPIIRKFGAANDNSSGYIWVGFRYPMYWSMAIDDWSEITTNKGWLNALQNWRSYSSPSGAVPNFGDTSGWGTGSGISVGNYELIGRLTGDGRFRWQAHRNMEYLYNHFWPRHDQYHGPKDLVALGACLAWLQADDSVKPKPAESQSQVLFRYRTAPVTQEESAARPGLSTMKLTDEQVPDKLILTSGTRAQQTWAMVELIDLGGHCGQLPGNIIALMHHDAALLAGQGYYEKSPDFNNILWIEDLDGLAADPRPARTEVPIFVEDPAVTRVRIRVQRFQQLPVTYVRDIVFVKDAFMLVKDRITFHATMRVRVGPCWQTRDLGPQCKSDLDVTRPEGDFWFNSYYEYLYHTGLGLGRGVQAYRNPAWDLLVKFAPREGMKYSVVDRFNDNPYRMSPVQLRQSWTGIIKHGETLTFTSLLHPHVPAFDVEPFAEWSKFLIDNDQTTMVRVKTENDPQNHLWYEHFLLLQEKVGAVESDGFAGDSTFALISKNYKGDLSAAVMVGGKELRLGGEEFSPKSRKPIVQTVYELKE
ncbi:MAG: hypothetical protein O3B01_27695 [Planctomycetota bacterium]|nr:hypothetical protein [Planctomycetota bacterium]MDA1142364.1 hypothetical protein [Planctomycetota bacterium]